MKEGTPEKSNERAVSSIKEINYIIDCIRRNPASLLKVPFNSKSEISISRIHSKRSNYLRIVAALREIIGTNGHLRDRVLSNLCIPIIDVRSWISLFRVDIEKGQVIPYIEFFGEKPVPVADVLRKRLDRFKIVSSLNIEKFDLAPTSTKIEEIHAFSYGFKLKYEILLREMMNPSSQFRVFGNKDSITIVDVTKNEQIKLKSVRMLWAAPGEEKRVEVPRFNKARRIDSQTFEEMSIDRVASRGVLEAIENINSIKFWFKAIKTMSIPEYIRKIQHNRIVKNAKARIDDFMKDIKYEFEYNIKFPLMHNKARNSKLVLEMFGRVYTLDHLEHKSTENISSEVYDNVIEILADHFMERVAEILSTFNHVLWNKYYLVVRAGNRIKIVESHLSNSSVSNTLSTLGTSTQLDTPITTVLRKQKWDVNKEIYISFSTDRDTFGRISLARKARGAKVLTRSLEEFEMIELFLLQELGTRVIF